MRFCRQTAAAGGKICTETVCTASRGFSVIYRKKISGQKLNGIVIHNRMVEIEYNFLLSGGVLK